MKLARNRSRARGFTLVELLVVALVLTALLTLAVAPALGRTRLNAETHACRQNLHKLSAAWTLYSLDNNSAVVGNVTDSESRPGVFGQRDPSWAHGYLDWGSGKDNTNTLLVASPRYSKLYSYLGGNSRIFRCPTDRYVSFSQFSLGWTSRVRSYSSPVGIGSSSAALPETYQRVRSTHEFLNPTPSDAMVFLEQHPDSISGPSFDSPYNGEFIEIPAVWHGRGMNMAMADGGSRSVAWTGDLAVNRYQGVSFGTLYRVPHAVGDPDASLLRYHTPRRTSDY